MAPYCLGYIGDDTTQLYGDFYKQLQRSISINQHNGKIRGFVRGSINEQVFLGKQCCCTTSRFHELFSSWVENEAKSM